MYYGYDGKAIDQRNDGNHKPLDKLIADQQALAKEHGRELTEDEVIDYLDRMADTIIDRDSVHFSYYQDSFGNRLPGLLFKKQFSDGVLQGFEIVSKGKKSISLQTLYMDSASYQKKKIAETLPMQNASASTHEAGASQSSNMKVAQPEAVVKKNGSAKSDGVKRSAQQKENATVADMLKKENEKLKADVDKLKELLKLQRTITGGTKFTESSVEAAARVLKKNAGATGNTAELASLLNSFYAYITTEKEGMLPSFSAHFI